MQGLYENKEYEFRVCAVNENGEGDYLEADRPIVAKLPFGELPQHWFQSSVKHLGPFPTERLRLRRRKQLGSVSFYATFHI